VPPFLHRVDPGENATAQNCGSCAPAARPRTTRTGLPSYPSQVKAADKAAAVLRTSCWVAIGSCQTPRGVWKWPKGRGQRRQRQCPHTAQPPRTAARCSLCVHSCGASCGGTSSEAPAPCAVSWRHLISGTHGADAWRDALGTSDRGQAPEQVGQTWDAIDTHVRSRDTRDQRTTPPVPSLFALYWTGFGVLVDSLTAFCLAIASFAPKPHFLCPQVFVSQAHARDERACGAVYQWHAEFWNAARVMSPGETLM